MKEELVELYEMLGVNTFEQARHVIMQTQLQLAMISEEKPLVGAIAINRKSKQIATSFAWGPDKIQDMRDMLEALGILQGGLTDRLIEVIKASSNTDGSVEG